jgi:hypothetical protein
MKFSALLFVAFVAPSVLTAPVESQSDVAQVAKRGELRNGLVYAAEPNEKRGELRNGLVYNEKRGELRNGLVYNEKRGELRNGLVYAEEK